MILFPAIDLKDGQCVRLKLGDMAQATVFNDDPARQASLFQQQGFEWLHIVDLDGAFAGNPVNQQAVENIISQVTIPIQLGGGIRTLSTIGQWLDRGVSRVILGTVAMKDPNLVKKACDLFPGRIVVGIDARGGRVATEGWAETSEMTVQALAQRFEDVGVSAIVFTDIDRDGILTGLNIDSTLNLASNTKIPVIASGGLASLEDIERLIRPDCAILEGAITGRAIYDGRLDPAQALELINKQKVGQA